MECQFNVILALWF